MRITMFLQMLCHIFMEGNSLSLSRFIGAVELVFDHSPAKSGGVRSGEREFVKLSNHKVTAAAWDHGCGKWLIDIKTQRTVRLQDEAKILINGAGSPGSKYKYDHI